MRTPERWYDVFYINKDVCLSHLPDFSNQWIRAFEKELPDYTAKIKPLTNGGNASKDWLSRRFGAEAPTYEVVDKTSRSLIHATAKAAAINMMELLLEREDLN